MFFLALGPSIFERNCYCVCVCRTCVPWSHFSDSRRELSKHIWIWLTVTVVLFCFSPSFYYIQPEAWKIPTSARENIPADKLNYLTKHKFKSACREKEQRSCEKNVAIKIWPGQIHHFKDGVQEKHYIRCEYFSAPPLTNIERTNTFKNVQMPFWCLYCSLPRGSRYISWGCKLPQLERINIQTIKDLFLFCWTWQFEYETVWRYETSNEDNKIMIVDTQWTNVKLICVFVKEKTYLQTSINNRPFCSIGRPPL